MPITNTLKTAAELRLAGFPENQATVLAEKFEETAAAVSEDLKTFISGELDRKLNEIRVELHSSLRDQTFKLMAILIAAISLAVAIIKMFPNAH
jgi:hypothetical protein